MNINTNISLKNKYEENICIQSNCVLNFDGLSTKTIEVQDTSTLIMHGMCNNIIINKNCSAIIHGTAKNITNYGKLEIYGIVKNLNDFSNNTYIDPEAIVHIENHSE